VRDRGAELAGPELTMQTDTLRVLVLPAIGGKIASLQWLPRNLDLLQAPLAPYAPRTMNMGFEESDASGFDECLPSVAACDLKTANGVVRVPDHGDFWRLLWEAEQSGNEIRMAATGVSLPLHFERTLRLADDTLDIAYRVTNRGDAALDYAWSAHPLLAVERGDRVLLPESVQHVVVEGSAGQRLGAKHSRHAWPRTVTLAREAVDLSVAGGIEDGIGDKLFAASPAEGWAAVERRNPGLRVAVHFDPKESPWLGLWLCYGGWPDGRAHRQQCVAIEPCTAPVDSLEEAVAGGWSRRLAPSQSNEWRMRIRVSRVS